MPKFKECSAKVPGGGAAKFLVWRSRRLAGRLLQLGMWVLCCSKGVFPNQPVNHPPTWKQIAHFVSLLGAGRASDTDEGVKVKGVHVLT
jgi:hypothetical protein